MNRAIVLSKGGRHLDGHRRSRRPHAGAGTTPVGKTRLAELLSTEDIGRGEVVIVFDSRRYICFRRRQIDLQGANFD